MSLQERIAGLAKELQEEILLQLIKAYLQPGKVTLRAHRFLKNFRPYRYKIARPGLEGEPWMSNLVHKAYANVYEPISLKILYALNSKWLKVAQELLYQGNSWIIPLGSCPSPGYWLEDHEKAKHHLLCVEITMGAKKPAYRLKGPQHRQMLRVWTPELYDIPNLKICEVLTDCGLQSARGKGKVAEHDKKLFGLGDPPGTAVPGEEEYEKGVKVWIERNLNLASLPKPPLFMAMKALYW